MEEKSSVSRVKKTSGIFTFRIEGYSGLSTKVGDSTESPEFDLCGHTWQLRIFPGGSLEAHRGYVSYYLASKSTRSARASYKLSVCSQIPGGSDESFASSGVRLFEAKGVQIDGWGRDKFMTMAMLADRDFGYCVNDIVVFRVDITVYGELEAASFPAVCTVNDNALLPSLSRSLRQLLNDEATADIIIRFNNSYYCGNSEACSASSTRNTAEGFGVDPKFNNENHPSSPVPSADTSCPCWRSTPSSSSSTSPKPSAAKRMPPFSESGLGASGESLLAHRCILSARSPVFKAMLVDCKEMSEGATGEIFIDDVDPAVMRECLVFMYTDECSDSMVMDSMAEALMCAAAKYQIASLSAVCETYLCTHITADSAVSLLRLGDMLSAVKIRDCALQFIAQHSASVMMTKDYRELDGELLREVTQAMDAVAKRKGCGRGSTSPKAAVSDFCGERRFATSCALM